VNTLYELHAGEIAEHARNMTRLSKDMDISTISFADLGDEWDDAQLGLVWEILK